MRTRSQRQAHSKSPTPPKKTKKEILQEKEKRKGKKGGPAGKKKIKTDQPIKISSKKKSPAKEPTPQVKSRGRTSRVSIDSKKDKSLPKNEKSNPPISQKRNIKQKSEEKKDKSQPKPVEQIKNVKPPIKPLDKTSSNLNKSIKLPNKLPKDKNQVDTKKQKNQQKPKADVKTDDHEPIQKVIVKGAAPIDPHYTGAKNVHVLVHGGKIYNATLNQTNTSNNNNKYYIIQALQSDVHSNSCYLFTRWGRVGFQGQQSLLGPYNVDRVVREYEMKFNEKHRKGDYRVVDINYDDEDKKQKKTDVSNNDKTKSHYEESKLPKTVKDLIELIFDLNMMNKHMVEIGYNVKKMPLGKLSKASIMKGYQILKELLAQIQGKNTFEKVQSLTDDFYSYIPHDFGFQKMSNFVLNTAKKVKDKLQLLEALGQIKIATNIISDGSTGNKLDENYSKLNRDFKPIEKGSVEYKLMEDYLLTTHANTHSSYKLQLVDLFGINDQRQNARFTKDINNKMLLWHGSRLTNFVGILSQGLRIAPPQAPVSGYMFGKGVYFADMSSKSANYCFTNRQNNTGILLLCEVALGDMNQKYHADYYASNLPPGKHSTKGLGRTAPPSNKYQIFKDMIIPMGPGQSTDIAGCSLMYNQYIVYDISQIRIRYLLRTKFNYR